MRCKMPEFLGAAVSIIATLAQGSPIAAEGLTTYESQFYVLETEVPAERAKFIGRLMDAAGKEYARRFEGFRGAVRRKPRLKVFSSAEGFRAALAKASGSDTLQNARGVFVHGDETVYTYDGRDGELERVLKHECFHQFVFFTVGGTLPAWANEGLAEYFAESVFEERTGRLRLGSIPAHRAKLLQAALQEGDLWPVDQLLHLSQQEWNDHIDRRGSVQYSQAWALCHFLVHAEGGKYEPAFTGFLREIDGGVDADTAFTRTFGEGTEDLQKKLEAYIRQLKPGP